MTKGVNAVFACAVVLAVISLGLTSQYIGYEKWNIVSAGRQQPTGEAIRRFWLDTVLWRQDMLQLLIEAVGKDRVVQGTDYPFGLCEWPQAALGEDGFRALLGS